MMTLETLGAREEIKELRARYFRTVDCKDWAAFGRLFVPGAVLDLRDDLGRVLHGRDAIVQFVAGGLDGLVSVHHGHMPEILVSSTTRATGIWAMEDRLFREVATGPPTEVLHGYGYYHDNYTRDEGGWLFESVVLRRIRVATP